MSPTRPTAPWGSERILDELDHLAAVEHALCVEYLTVRCALGHAQVDPAEPDGQRLNEAADAAFWLARSEMGHLKRLNQVLVASRRPVQLGRTASVSGPAGRIALDPPGATELARLVERERVVAAAVDARYEALGAAVATATEVPDGVASLLEPAPDHRAALGDFAAALQGIAPEVTARATRREPADDLERELLALADEAYALVVRLVGVWLARDEELFGALQPPAVKAMDALDAVGPVLVARGLLPRFTLPAGV